MVESIYITFDDYGDITESQSNKTFYFQGDNLPSQYGVNKRGNLSISRTINKNLIQNTLPVSSYTEGGLCIDIGFTDDTFSIDFETHSWYEYRLLASLVKCNTGMRSGVFYFGGDSYVVAVRNCSFSFPSGRGGSNTNDRYVKINIALTVVNSRFAK